MPIFTKIQCDLDHVMHAFWYSRDISVCFSRPPTSVEEPIEDVIS